MHTAVVISKCIYLRLHCYFLTVYDIYAMPCSCNDASSLQVVYRLAFLLCCAWCCNTCCICNLCHCSIYYCSVAAVHEHSHCMQLLWVLHQFVVCNIHFVVKVLCLLAGERHFNASFYASVNANAFYRYMVILHVYEILALANILHQDFFRTGIFVVAVALSPVVAFAFQAVGCQYQYKSVVIVVTSVAKACKHVVFYFLLALVCPVCLYVDVSY